MARVPSPAKEHAPQLDELRHRMRHSAAHVMADAVIQLFPEAKLAIGPATVDGFYYDFQVSRPFTPEDLELIEERMSTTISENHSFQLEEISRQEAARLFSNQPYKMEIIDGIPLDEKLTTYQHGGFVDLCEGPHVESTDKIQAFKLLSVAGAYWRGDENRPMLQRIYGTAFETVSALAEFLQWQEESEKRDHRKVGRQLGLFTVHDEIGPGLVVWHPKGATIRTIVEDYWKAVHQRLGYNLVYSPHLGRARLWQISGHLDFYHESMYPPIDVDGQEYYIKPMNCPFHIMIYKSSIRSYRDLPIRYGELGTVYRYERSGVLHGLMRVRGFTQDDAHIFCRSDQVEDEVLGVLDLTFEILSAFGFQDYSLSLSTIPAKYVGELDMWQHATKSLQHALERRGLDYDLDEGGGAFYGPKIDLKIKDALGRDWQCTTVQFDFNLPERFDLSFQGSDGGQHRPYMVHRAILGSIERFIGVLTEHYGGAFPVWLAPVQAIIIPIADRHLEYADRVYRDLRDVGFRPEVDSRKERMNLKVRDAQAQKVPFMLVVGDQEAGQGTVSVRLRTEESLGPMPISAFIQLIDEKVASKL
jgi:threonyl-tRNA synthetase